MNEDTGFVPPHHVNPSDEDLRTLLTGARTIAIVGASSDLHKPSHGIMKQLLAAGYRVIPVNPQESEVLGRMSFPSLEAVPEPVDIVDVFRKSKATPAIADSAVTIGARALWLQEGISNDDAAARAKAGGLTVVMDRCIGAAHTALGIPNKT